MFYANSEYFRNCLIELTGVDPQNPQKHSSIGSSSSVYYRHNSSDPGSPSIEITKPAFPLAVNTALENGVITVTLLEELINVRCNNCSCNDMFFCYLL